MEVDKNLEVDPTAVVSADARIHPSSRGSRIKIGAHTYIFEFVILRAVGGSGDLVIGEHCYINPSTTIYSGSGVTIGDYVLIGPGCVIAPANHAFSRLDIPIRNQGFMPSRGGVFIDTDVWIGANCTILDGASIGRGAIVAAGSLVRGEIEPLAIYGGAPARKIGRRGA